MPHSGCRTYLQRNVKSRPVTFTRRLSYFRIGIGRAAALEFARRGANLAVAHGVDLCCDGIVTQAASISDTKIEVVSLLLREGERATTAPALTMTPRPVGAAAWS
jgi:NAD(P)-dependent dehydrogenase (short-subunit alcohol dehydrogenase family)